MLDPANAPVIGKYLVLEHIGSGSMASVYKVQHQQLEAIYALKVLDGTAGRMADRLLREGRVQAGLRHPNVVTVHDVLEVEGDPALLMDYVAGPTLKSFLLGYHPLDLDTIDTLVRGILKGVRAVHQAGHLHRDIKPGNILLEPHDGEWTAKIADFGLAKVFGNPNDPIQTRSGQLLGSPAFMSPEQTMSSNRLDGRTDIWALGAVIYQLITGHLAFPHRDIVTIFSMIRRGDYRDPRTLRDGIPDRMWGTVFAAMTVDPEHRAKSCDDLLKIWNGEVEPPLNPGSPVPETVDFPLLDEAPTIQAGPPRPSPLPLPPAPTPIAPPTPVAPPTPAAAQPAQRRWWIGAALAGSSIAILLLAWSLWAPTVAPSPPPPPTPTPLSTRTPQPVPVVAPPSQVPEPKPSARLPTKPAPRPIEPAPPTPDPEPPPSPPMGQFRFTGDAEQVWLVRNGQHHEAGPLEPGVYTVSARFKGKPLAPIEGLRVQIKPNAVATIDCRAGFFTCRQR